jgi:hypothetical protein
MSVDHLRVLARFERTESAQAMAAERIHTWRPERPGE